MDAHRPFVFELQAALDAAGFRRDQCAAERAAIEESLAAAERQVRKLEEEVLTAGRALNDARSALRSISRSRTKGSAFSAATEKVNHLVRVLERQQKRLSEAVRQLGHLRVSLELKSDELAELHGAFRGFERLREKHELVFEAEKRRLKELAIEHDALAAHNRERMAGGVGSRRML